MTYRKWPGLAVAAVLASAFAWTAAPHAQTMQQQRPPQQQQPPAQTQNFESGELKSYARARMEVRRISQSYQPKMQSAQSKEERKKLNEEAMNRMKSVIRDKGLSVQKYNKITVALQSDPELAAQIQNYMAETQ